MALAAQEETLETLDWRLLTWLLRYPLQRADDLVLGVARWASRATAYRHLTALQDRQLLIEQVLPKTPGSGRRVYLLSNLGLHVLARHLGMSADALASERGADESGLFRLLPRLSTLLVVQNVVNGLIVHAADAMTAQGRRPQLVRWTWQRDLTHRFLSREQPLRLFVDAAVALCLRTPQEDGRMLDQWYGLCLLFTELNDERLMRLRLERLHSFREAPERWAHYQQMMPVLILALSSRQREHWQRAADIAALKLRLEPLNGATAALVDPTNASLNPWRFGWRTLATEASCHLQELLSPLSRTAFLPELCVVEEQDESSDSQQGTTPALSSPQMSGHVRRIITGDLQQRAAHITQGAQDERTVVALLGVRLTPRQWSILNMLLVHPLLADEELAVFLNLQQTSLRCSLYALHRLGCAEAVNTAIGKRWHLCERGLRVIATANHLSLRNLAILEEALDTDESSLVRRGESWLLRHIQHTAGIYGFFATLAQAARQHPDHDLCWWETGAMCERRYQVNEAWHNLRPDALAEYRAGERRIRFWLEWDRGTMNARDLATKCTAYAHYLVSREWARERSPLPLLVCVTPEIAQEQRLVRVAQATLAHVPGLVLWTTTVEQLDKDGPRGPIWRQHSGTKKDMLHVAGSSRQGIFGGDIWK